MKQRKSDEKFPKISWESSFNKPKIDMNKSEKLNNIYSNEINHRLNVKKIDIFLSFIILL